MMLSFTGHRDCNTPEPELDKIRLAFPDSTWIHGGAMGFDTQVEAYAKKYGIKTIVVKPDYKTYVAKVAPLVRDRKIVDLGAKVFACWDGRKKGGTYYTMEYARKMGKEVVVLEVVGVSG